MNKYNELFNLINEAGKSGGGRFSRAWTPRFNEPARRSLIDPDARRAFGAQKSPVSGMYTRESLLRFVGMAERGVKRAVTPDEITQAQASLKGWNARLASHAKINPATGKRADEGLRDALKSAARTGLAVGAGYFGGQLSKDTESSTRATTSHSVRAPKGTPKYSIDIDKFRASAPFSAATNREARSRDAATLSRSGTRGGYIAKEVRRNVRGKNLLPLSSGYRTTTTPPGEASSNVRDVVQHADLNVPWDLGRGKERTNILKRWKGKKRTGL